MDRLLAPIFKSPQDRHYFFGYYDKSQLSRCGRFLLAMQVSRIDKIPDRFDVAKIGWFDLTADDPQEFHEIAETNAFNWQQGSMLQWLGPDHCSLIIFNDFVDGRLGCRVIDLTGSQIRTFEHPIYSVSSDGDFSLSTDFERHTACRRGYSYDVDVPTNKRQRIVDGDGIWRLDFINGVWKQIVGLDQLLLKRPLSNMRGAVHYVEHVMLSPDNKKFMFLHRWQMESGGIFSRLYVCDSDGQHPEIILDSGRVGHYNWWDDRSVLVYGGVANLVNRTRKYKSLVKYIFQPLLPLYHRLVKDNSVVSKIITGDSYLLIDLVSKNVERVAPEISREDGHPSRQAINSTLFITDTYPAHKNGHVAKLLSYDVDTGVSNVLASLKSIPMFDESALRCDLHPKVSLDGNYVAVDTMDGGVRGIYVYFLADLESVRNRA